MKVSMLNAIRGLSEYVSEEMAKQPFSWANVGVAMYAEYKLQTSGILMLKQLDDGTGYIAIDALSALVEKYEPCLQDSTFKTPIGELTITKDTPKQILEHLKKYGEN